jgi:hypothetical protein
VFCGDRAWSEPKQKTARLRLDGAVFIDKMNQPSSIQMR